MFLIRHIKSCNGFNYNQPTNVEQLYIELNSKVQEPVLLSNLIGDRTRILEVKSEYPLNYNYNFIINNDYVGESKTIYGFSLPVRRIFSMEDVFCNGHISLTLGTDFDNNFNNLTTYSNVAYLSLYGDPTKTYPLVPIQVLPNRAFSKLLDYFLLTNVGPVFNINGQFPLKRLPPNLKSFSFENGKIELLPDFSIFRNTSIVNSSFKGNSIVGTLPKWEENVNKIVNLNLEGNNLMGSIDKSYCSVLLNVKDNQLNGSLPDCYVCNLKDPAFILNFEGNNFNNIDDRTDCKIIPNLKITYEQMINKQFLKIPKVRLYGLNIGYDQNKIIYEPNIYNFEIIKANSIMEAYYSPERLIHKINFTISNQIFWASPDPYPPQIFNITKIGEQLTISGQYFSYDPSFVRIIVGGISCIVENTQFYFIQCQLSTVPTQFKNLSSTIRIDELETKFNYDLEDENLYSQCDPTFCSYPKGQCNYYYGNIGKCDCNSEWTGQICSTPNQYVSSVLSTDENGGFVQMNGWFGDIHENSKVFIGDNECSSLLISTYSLNCVINAGKGSHDITVVQNGIEWVGAKMYTYISIEQSCLNNCTSESNGICNTSTGNCLCKSNWMGIDCSTQVLNPNEGGPKSNSTVNPDGSTTVVNENTSYNIYITSLLELNINSEPIKEYPLETNWIVNNTNDNEYNSTVSFSQTLKEIDCQVVLLVQEIKKESNYSFAGIDFKLEPGSIKVSVSITNYRYQSPLNTLQLQMISNVSSNTIDCNTKSTESTTSLFDNQLLNYITIRKDNKVLYGRFINRAMLDERPRTITTSLISNTNESITIGINIPHCNQCHIDPDFSVLVSPDFKSNCESSSKKSYIIPVAIVASVVGVALIIGGTFAVYKRRIELKYIKKVIRLSKLNK
ncbi:hypothetical protein DICPUDRAFT_155455 [Dictyostelium purpureum]|uniref:EGF-like domain-containing protein n=1 Tax=Dictyostelium purpureum TaxID=5786 RepID=F0ZU26_DICPU|nr:uncharacterized protein DICPUDRAFT_155455 [Dictyostelium purpureum]EGC32543.1 hypothetical protein DICPUDRAFT_155455 [Dictyostelium purpureum]|eukprot:XP_003290919.1 hypothetical protein DICPUDRAFT_155455 [Dictyostelium purpureum]